MGTVLASTLINTVSSDLLDSTNDRWSRAELLGYLNDGQLAICVIKPDVYTVTDVIKLSAGSKQSAPADCIQFQKVLRNMGTDGLTPGKAIPLVSMQHLDLVAPSWHSATASAVTKHWIFEEKNPKVFWVYPKSDGTGYVEAIMCKIPANIATEALAIILDDIYRVALYHYMMHRSYLKDADSPANASLAQLHYQSFANSLVMKEQREKTEQPVPGKE